MIVNLTKTDKMVLIDLIDEVLTENFIHETNTGSDVNEEYDALLKRIKTKLEK
jgi:riboflavin synthase alpha subunit